jgi:hypothetical protein
MPGPEDRLYALPGYALGIETAHDRSTLLSR